MKKTFLSSAIVSVLMVTSAMGMDSSMDINDVADELFYKNQSTYNNAASQVFSNALSVGKLSENNIYSESGFNLVRNAIQANIVSKYKKYSSDMDNALKDFVFTNRGRAWKGVVRGRFDNTKKKIIEFLMRDMAYSDAQTNKNTGAEIQEYNSNLVNQLNISKKELEAANERVNSLTQLLETERTTFEKQRTNLLVPINSNLDSMYAYVKGVINAPAASDLMEQLDKNVKGFVGLLYGEKAAASLKLKEDLAGMKTLKAEISEHERLAREALAKITDLPKESDLVVSGDDSVKYSAAWFSKQHLDLESEIDRLSNEVPSAKASRIVSINSRFQQITFELTQLAKQIEVEKAKKTEADRHETEENRLKEENEKLQQQMLENFNKQKEELQKKIEEASAASGTNLSALFESTNPSYAELSKQATGLNQEIDSQDKLDKPAESEDNLLSGFNGVEGKIKKFEEAVFNAVKQVATDAQKTSNDKLDSLTTSIEKLDIGNKNNIRTKEYAQEQVKSIKADMAKAIEDAKTATAMKTVADNFATDAAEQERLKRELEHKKAAEDLKKQKQEVQKIIDESTTASADVKDLKLNLSNEGTDNLAVQNPLQEDYLAKLTTAMKLISSEEEYALKRLDEGQGRAKNLHALRAAVANRRMSFVGKKNSDENVNGFIAAYKSFMDKSAQLITAASTTEKRPAEERKEEEKKEKEAPEAEEKKEGLPLE